MMNVVSRLTVRMLMVSALLLFALPVRADGRLKPLPDFYRRKQLVASLPSGEGYGEALAMSGDRLVVGQRDNGENGRAHVYVRGASGAWTLEATLRSTVPGGGEDCFGCSVAIEGDYIAVGAPREGEGGHAYVFMRSGSSWRQIAKLGLGFSYAHCAFGSAVALEADIVVVTAPCREGVDDHGLVQIFRRSGTQYGRVDEIPVTAGGAAVALYGGELVVGEPTWNQARGVISFYDRVGNTFRLRESRVHNFPRGTRFGSTLWFDADTLIVGAPYATHSGIANAGAVYVHAREDHGGFGPGTRIVASNPVLGGGFGTAVTMSAGAILVGEPGTPAGQIHMYLPSTDGGFVESRTFTIGVESWDRLGASLVGSETSRMFIAGAPDTGFEGEGMVYEWTRTMLSVPP